MSKIASGRRSRTAARLALAGLALAGCRASPEEHAGEAPAASGQSATQGARTGYAPIGRLKMYYEVHGTGEPVLLIHGAISTIQTSFRAILPELSKERQAIAIEGQGHGHTADIDRPLTFEQMGDDAAALLRHLRVAKADVIGYSDGGNVALAGRRRSPRF